MSVFRIGAPTNCTGIALLHYEVLRLFEARSYAYTVPKLFTIALNKYGGAFCAIRGLLRC